MPASASAAARSLLPILISTALLALPVPASAGSSTKKQLKELNAKIDALTAQLAELATTVETVSADTAAIREEVVAVQQGLGQKLLADSSVQLCAEFAVEGEVELAAAAEAKVEGEGSLGAEVAANGGKVDAQARGKGGWKWAVKGTGALPKLVYCFDVLQAADQILAARATPGASRAAAATPFDPTQLSPAIQDYILALAQHDRVDLADRMGGVAQFAGLTPTAMNDTFEAVALANGNIDPMSVLNGNGPLRELGASLPLPPGVRQSLQEPGRITSTLAGFRPCELSGLDPDLQQVVDGACAAAPSWDPADAAQQLGGIGGLVSDASTILQKTTAMQTVLGAVRTLAGRICTAISAIPGVNPNCSV